MGDGEAASVCRLRWLSGGAWPWPRPRSTSLPPPARLPQGSLASGTFAAYSPVTREAEVCDVQPLQPMEDEAEEAEETDGV